MRRNICLGLILLGLVIPATVIVGCGSSKSSQFYTLNPVTTKPSSPSTTGTAQSGPTIGIASVEIPDYIDRPQIVTRNANNGVEVAEFDRWAGDLQNDIALVLAETMSARLPEDDVFVSAGRRAIPADYRVMVNIMRFDAVPGAEVWLKALWTIRGKRDQSVEIRGESNLAEPIRGTGYGAIVAAMSRAVDRLGNEIAETMKPVLAKAAGPRQG